MLGKILSEFESEIRAGNDPRIEHYLLPSMPPRTRRMLLRELLRCESSLRRTPPAKLKDRIAEFPEIAKNSRVIRAILWGVYNDLWQEGISLSWKWYDEFGYSPQSLRIFLQGDIPGYFLGQVIHGRYHLEQRLGAGEGSLVFKAWDDVRQDWVALKLLNIADAASKDKFQKLLQREFQLNQKVQGPGILPIWECIAESDYDYLVMDYMPGGSLRDLLKVGPVSPRKAAELLLTVAQTLVRLHGMKIWHRDLKPANILFDRHNAPVVADFGLGLEQHEQWNLDGQLAGSYPYMSPNRLFGQVSDLDGRSDIFSVGMMFYELIHGRRPFPANDRENALVCGIVSYKDIPFSKSVPDAVKKIILRCLQRERNLRYDCVFDLLDDLRNFAASQSD
jgi:serine/threonine-protein kinase